MPSVMPKKSEHSSRNNLAQEEDEDKGAYNEAFDENYHEENETRKEEPPRDATCNGVDSETVRNQETPASSKSIQDYQSGHSRGTSGTITGHSRGTSTDGSTLEAYTPSGTESRRGTYSEAATLPIGMTQEGTPIMEENGPPVLITEKNGIGHNKDSNHWNSLRNFAKPIIKKHNALPPEPSVGDRVKYALLCPPHGTIGNILMWIVFLLMFWGTLYFTTKEAALPGGTFFSLMVLVVCAEIGGQIVAKVKLPPLLGMLIVGILFRNLNVFGAQGIQKEWSSSLRSMALAVILSRAGLGLDPAALRKLSFVVLRLAMMPCLVETTAVAVMSHFLLGFPWIWGFMLGFILAAVSPAVVVPCLLNLSDMGYGVEKGIPTLVIAAASIDDVLAISGFGISLGVAFSKGSPLMKGLKGPIEVAMGIGFGVIVGLILWILPNRKRENSSVFRFLMLFFAGLFAIFGTKKIGYDGAGALGCLTVAFVAGIGWRNKGYQAGQRPVGEYFNLMWQFFQPMLFGLIGTEIELEQLDGATVGNGLACLAVGLFLRIITSFFAVAGGGLNIKERFFVALAWLPKATVQAAIGSVALDTARGLKDDLLKGITGSDLTESMREELLQQYDESMHYGLQVLTIAVLVILITAPIGAVAIMLSAPKLLKRKLPDSEITSA